MDNGYDDNDDGRFLLLWEYPLNQQMIPIRGRRKFQSLEIGIVSQFIENEMTFLFSLGKGGEEQ